MIRFRGMARGVILILSAVAIVSCSRKPSKARQQYMKDGDQYFAQAKYREALIEYRNAAQLDPRSGETRQKLSVTYERAGDPLNAYREAIRAADLLPDDVATQLRAAKYLIAAQQFTDAKVRADRVLVLDPKNVDGFVTRGYALAGLKDIAGATKEIEEAIELDPNEPTSYDRLGTLQLVNGQTTEAEAAFKQAVQVDPKSVNAHLALGAFYWSTKHPADAEAEFQAALTADPNSEAPHRTLATFYNAFRRSADAETQLLWLADNSKDVRSQLQLVDFYLMNRRKADAVKRLQALSSRPEAFAEVQSRMATLHYADGDKQTANQIIDDVLRREPQNTKALLVKTDFLANEGHTDEAIARAKAAIVVDPRLTLAHFMLGGLYTQKRDLDEAIKEYHQVLALNPKASAAQLQIARLQMAKGATASSVEAANSAVALEPNNPTAQLVLAKTLITSGDIKRAEPIIRALTAKYPNSPAVEVERGRLLGLTRNNAESRQAFEHALKLQPTSVEAVAGLVTLDVMEHKGAEARALVDARLAKGPEDSTLMLLAAKTYLATGQLDSKVADLLHKAIEADPSNIDSYGALATYYLTQNKVDDALQQYEEALKRTPTSVVALTATGMLFELQHKTAEAQKRYEQAVKFDPHAAVASNNLAWIYASQDSNLDVALKLAQAAKEALPESAQVNDTLGWVCYKKGLPTYAIDAFTVSTSKDPKNPVYEYHLGLAYLLAGNAKSARGSLQHALEMASNFDGATDARQKLDSIKGL